jgi:hypothetical protein
MKNIFSFSLILLAALSFSSCDHVEFPNPPTADASACDTVPIQRILIEDYTGQGCGNCPGAAVVARDLKALYNCEVIVVGVHAGWFATQGEGNPWPSTFLTTPGEAYNDYWGIDALGNPKGLVNRTPYETNVVLGKGNWGAATAQFIGLTPTAEVAINASHTGTSISVDVDYEFLESMSGNYGIIVWIAENDVYNWQLNYTGGGDPQYPEGDVEDYKHEHVLRDALSAPWGDAITGPTSAGSKGTLSYSYTADAAWDLDKSSIVVSLVNLDTRVVVNARDAHFD